MPMTTFVPASIVAALVFVGMLLANQYGVAQGRKQSAEDMARLEAALQSATAQLKHEADTMEWATRIVKAHDEQGWALPLEQK